MLINAIQVRTSTAKFYPNENFPLYSIMLLAKECTYYSAWYIHDVLQVPLLASATPDVAPLPSPLSRERDIGRVLLYQWMTYLGQSVLAYKVKSTP